MWFTTSLPPSLQEQQPTATTRTKSTRTAITTTTSNQNPWTGGGVYLQSIFWAVCHVFIFSSGLITPWHDLNSSRIGFLPRLRTIRCCCLEDWFGAMGDGQNQSSQKHATFWEMHGVWWFRKKWNPSKVESGLKRCHEGIHGRRFSWSFSLLSIWSFQLYAWVGMLSLPATPAIARFLVGDPYSPELSSCYWVGMHPNVWDCYVSFLGVKSMICWHPQKCELMPKTCEQWPKPCIVNFINGNFTTQLYVWNMTSRYEDLLSPTKRPAMSKLIMLSTENKFWYLHWCLKAQVLWIDITSVCCSSTLMANRENPAYEHETYVLWKN